jgi:hypothetical protein
VRIERDDLMTEDDLLSGELVVEGRLVDASNATLYGFVQQDISKRINVVYKPVAGERPLWDFPDGNLASREVAAYLISKHAGLDCVPTTVMREGPFGIGAVQEWIDVDEEIDFIEFAQKPHRDIRRIALFDVMINNTDRKFGHILINQQKRVFGCDHGVSFHEDFKLRTVLWQFAGEGLYQEELEIVKNVQEWIASPASQYFRSLLTEDEVGACIERLNSLSEEGFPFPSDEWPAVPWPPV